MMNNNNLFDKELQNRINSEELPFDPMAWEMMEEKLDNTNPKTPFWSSIKKYLIGTTALTILAALIYWPILQNNNLIHNNDSFSHLEPVDNNPTKVSAASAPTLVSTIEKSTGDSKQLLRNEETKMTDSNTSLSANGDTQVVAQGSSAVTPTRKSITQKIVQKMGGSALAVDQESKAIQSTGATKTTADTGNVTSMDEAAPVSDKKVSSFNTGLLEDNEVSRKEQSLLEELSDLESLETDFLSHDRDMPNDIDLVDVESVIERPKHQINLSLGAGQTQVNIEEPTRGSAMPTATSQKELFLSLSYLFRKNRHLGFEMGLQGSIQNNRFSNYFEQGEYGLQEPRYATIGISIADDFSYELFSNVHFFLPLNQRSELDFYAGYYARNLFQPSGGWGSGTGIRLDPASPGTTLIESRTEGESGPLEGGRIKLGLNYNFLTNKLNNVGIGISYMHEVIKDIDGMYSFFSTSDETRVLGDFKTNGSGLKVQLTYGFGLNKAPWQQQIFKKEDTGLRSPWYLGVRYGQKQYKRVDELSVRLIGSTNNQTAANLYVGHYVKPKLAVEYGLGYSQFNYSTRTSVPDNSGVRRLGMFTVPIALRRDIVQTNFITAYAKAIASTDFRMEHSDLFVNSNSVITEDKLLLNAGLAAGIDLRLFKGFNLGLMADFNHAFSNTAVIQQPVLAGGTANEILLEDLTLRNSYISFGAELKYYFNR